MNRTLTAALCAAALVSSTGYANQDTTTDAGEAHAITVSAETAKMAIDSFNNSVTAGTNVAEKGLASIDQATKTLAEYNELLNASISRISAEYHAKAPEIDQKVNRAIGLMEETKEAITRLAKRLEAEGENIRDLNWVVYLVAILFVLSFVARGLDFYAKLLDIRRKRYLMVRAKNMAERRVAEAPMEEPRPSVQSTEMERPV